MAQHGTGVRRFVGGLVTPPSWHRRSGQPPEPPRSTGSGALSLFLVLVVLFSLFRYLHGLAKLLLESSFIDFGHYYTFAMVVAHGLDPFNAGDVARVDDLLRIRRAMSPPDYPPLFYLLMRPWLLLPFRASAVAWIAVSQACLFGALLLCVRRFPSAGPVNVAATLFVMLNYQPLTEGLALGQSDVMLLFLLTLAWWAFRQRCDWVTASVVALTAHVKVQYALLIPLLWWSGQRRACALALLLAAVGFGASILMLGLSYPVEYIRFLLSFPDGFFYWTANLSVRATLHRLLGLSPEGWALATGLTLAVDAALVAALGWIIPRQTSPDSPAADWVWCLGLTAIPLLSPLMEEHHLVILLLPLTLLLLSETDGSVFEWERAVLVASIVLLASRYSLTRFPEVHQGTLSLLVTGKLLGAAGLAWVLAQRLRVPVRARREGVDRDG